MATVRAPQRALDRTVAPVGPELRPESEPGRDLRIVVPGRRRSRATAVTAAGVAVLFVLLLGAVVSQTVLVQNQQRLDRLDDLVQAEQSRYQKLRLDVARLAAPERIVDSARNRLGMEAPEGTIYLTPAVPTTVAAEDEAAAGTEPAPEEPMGTSSWSEIKPELGAAGR
ncbi:MAG: hypothetical protein ACT4PW_10465 [Acidimicrobiia bacterium]